MTISHFYAMLLYYKNDFWSIISFKKIDFVLYL